MSGRLVVEAISAAMTFRSFADPAASAADAFDGSPERLVVLGDVRTREVRVVTRRDAQEEVASAVIARIWRGL